MIFDFIVIKLKNTGPKIKMRTIITIIAIIVITSGIVICIASMAYLLQFESIDESYKDALQLYIRATMVCGILSPVLELIINKPPDD